MPYWFTKTFILCGGMVSTTPLRPCTLRDGAEQGEDEDDFPFHIH
jgi:hypothetical protein